MADIHDIVMFSLAGRLVWGRGPDWVCVTMGTLGHLPRQQHCSLATSRNTVPMDISQALSLGICLASADHSSSHTSRQTPEHTWCTADVCVSDLAMAGNQTSPRYKIQDASQTLQIRVQFQLSLETRTLCCIQCSVMAPGLGTHSSWRCALPFLLCTCCIS